MCEIALLLASCQSGPVFRYPYSSANKARTLSHRNPTNPVTKGEEKQLRSVVGSLSWIARQARPDILYQVSKLQPSIKGATVSTFKEANKVLELALDIMDLKLRYKKGPFNFQELGVLTASDASFAGEPGSKSQQGRIHFLVPSHQLLDPQCFDYDVMIVSFSRTTIKRVCRATLQTETYALQNARFPWRSLRRWSSWCYLLHPREYRAPTHRTAYHKTLIALPPSCLLHTWSGGGQQQHVLTQYTPTRSRRRVW